MRVVFLTFLSIVLMTVDHQQKYLDGVRAALSLLVYPIHFIVTLPDAMGSWAEENMVSRDSLVENNTKLRSQNLFLKQQNQKLISLEVENMRLRRLLDASKKVSDKILTAELLAVDLDPFSHKVLLNRGSLHDVYEGQAILAADGVYGQVVQVMPLSSAVMLISDPSGAVPVEVNRNGLTGIMAGMGRTDRLKLMNIPNNADVKVGDVLVTSGMGGLFPTGYPVAKVTQVLPDTSHPFATVYAKPLAALDRTREVMLVWHNSMLPAQEAPPTINDTASPATGAGQ